MFLWLRKIATAHISSGSAAARLAVAALVAVLTAGLSILAATPATAATIGSMSVTPASGNDTTGNIVFDSSVACPAEATNVIINIAGAGFPANSNAVGNSDIAIYSTNPQGGLTIPLGQTWETLAQSQGATLPLSGTATLTMRCIDIFNSQSFGEIPMQVQFTPTTGTHFDYAEVGGNPTPTPTPTPTNSQSPTPTESPTPSHTPTPTDSSTPAPTSSQTSAGSSISTSVGGLAHTGANGWGLAVLGAALVAVGAAFIAHSRRAELLKFDGNWNDE